MSESRPQREWHFYIEDMIGFAEKVLAYTDGLDQEDFIANDLTYDATLRNLELIGEAATRIPDEVCSAHPEIPDRAIGTLDSSGVDYKSMILMRRDGIGGDNGMSTDSQTPIVIYQDAGQAVEVRLDTERDTVWLNLQQLSEVFGREKSVISRHLRNIYQEGELEREATVAKNATVQSEGSRQVRRQIELYNLDAIISVGYRVNSRCAVQFRQWATRVLREHLTQGWTLNRQRFEDNARELEAAMALIRQTAQSPALEAKAAHLLYFVIKNHPFAAGNKRSAAYLFVDFLYRSDRLLNDHGEAVVNDVGLAALMLLVAESDPANKETMIRLIMNMLASPREGS